MNVLSLFAGVGGFDLGFQRAGFTSTAYAEIDPYARATMQRHFSEAQSFEDVHDVAKRTVNVIPDVICGGFPCQDVSIAGGRAGLAGNRSGLWFEFLRILDEFKPRWVVVENVTGLLTSNAGRDFATILSGLVKCGYGVSWRVLDAQYFGVVGRLRRLFIVGSLGNGCSAKILFEPQGGTGHIEPRPASGQGVTADTPGGAGKRRVKTLTRWDSQRTRVYVADEDTIAPTLDMGGGDGDKQGMRIYLKGEAETFRMRGFGDYVADSKASTIKARDGRDATDLIATPAGIVRRLTPAECERLQGFPDGWTDEHGDAQRYKMMGNAVCVNVAAWIGKRIKELETHDE